MDKKPVMFMLMLVLTVPGWSLERLTFGGQIRHRFEIDHKALDASQATNSFSVLRTRLQADFRPSDNVHVVIQLQDSRILGSERNPDTSSVTSNVTLTDGSADLFDLHQGFIGIDQLFDLPLDVKVGRYEVNYGPQRLIGAVGWHNIGRSFDGATFTLHTEPVDIDLFHLKEIEASPGVTEKSILGAYADLKFEDYTTQAFVIRDAERLTVGTYAKGRIIRPFSHETEFAIQRGSDGAGTAINTLMGAVNVSLALDRLLLTAGIDFLSGDDTGTAGYEAFNTLYATNHKYYGHMDYFLNPPVNTGGRGLIDLHLKGAVADVAGFGFKGALHLFRTHREDAAGNANLGTEIDLTATRSYQTVDFTAGYSLFFPGNLMEEAGGRDPASWFYLMTLVNF